MAKDRKLVAKHQNLQLLSSVAAADEHDQLEQAQDNDVERADTSKGDLQQTGTPTLPPPDFRGLCFVSAERRLALSRAASSALRRSASRLVAAMTTCSALMVFTLAVPSLPPRPDPRLVCGPGKII